MSFRAARGVSAEIIITERGSAWPSKMIGRNWAEVILTGSTVRLFIEAAASVKTKAATNQRATSAEKALGNGRH